MTDIRLLFVLFGLQCCFALVGAYRRYVLASDFSPQELSNLTRQQEHELQLKKLLQKDAETVAIVLGFEFVVKSTGNDFWAFTADDEANAEITAIAKATFACFTRVQLHHPIRQLTERAARRAASKANETASLSDGLSYLSSEFDALLKDETYYAATKEAFKKVQIRGSPPTKVYQYGIPKTDDDLRRSVAELGNDPQIRKLRVLSSFSFRGHRDDAIVSQAVLELAKLPHSVEPLQKIFDATIDEVTEQVKPVNPDEVYPNLPANLILCNLKPILSEKMVSRINENADLKNDFETIRDRISHPDLGRP